MGEMCEEMHVLKLVVCIDKTCVQCGRYSNRVIKYLFTGVFLRKVALVATREEGFFMHERK